MVAQVVRKLRQRWRTQLKPLLAPVGPWRYSRALREDDPPQGWKIHISATPLSANDVFARAYPILRKHRALFKVPADLQLLEQLNSGVSGFSQVGKFITVYPCSTDEAVVLARELHSVTEGLRAPEIPFDARYRSNSLIYYRYGCFRSGDNGSAEAGVVFDPAGKPHKDRREPGRAVPRWIDNPFATKKRQERDASRFMASLAPNYLPFRAISQRGKGGVYEAVDLSVSPARVVIVKEGRRYGEVDWRGDDGYAQVRHEGRVLRALRKAGLPVPQVLAEFNERGNRYLVLEKIAGRALLPANTLKPGRASWRRAQKILLRLSATLSRLHRSGWVWRDCKPSHIFIQNGQVRLIDFEGACRIAQTELPPWGSPGYTPPIYRKTFSRRAGVLEDRYALGAIAFQLATGKLPPDKAPERGRLYGQVQCPDSLRHQIEALLDCRGSVIH